MGRDRGRGSNLSIFLEGDGGSRGGGGKSVDLYMVDKEHTRGKLSPENDSSRCYIS